MKLPIARKEKLTIRELPDETLVYDLIRHKSHCLNRTAALVWRHCDGQTTVAEMADILHAELDLPADQHIVRLALEQLGRRHLLEKALTPLSTKARISRREVLKKLAVAAAALPIVMTMTAKAGRVNASVRTTGQPCTSHTQCIPQNPGACTQPGVGSCIGGLCHNIPVADGTRCTSAAGTGTCSAGTCVPFPASR